MLPGRPSSPKKSRFSIALARRMRSCARPSMPAISFPGPDCSPSASWLTVSLRRPSLSTWYLLLLLPEKRPCNDVSIHTARQPATGQETGPTYRLEHIQGCDGNAFGPPVDSPVLHALVLPFCASTGIQQHADQEQVEHPLALLRVVDLLGPRRQKVGNPVAPTDAKVLVSAVSGDAREGGIVVSLSSRRGQPIGGLSRDRKQEWLTLIIFETKDTTSGNLCMSTLKWRSSSR